MPVILLTINLPTNTDVVRLVDAYADQFSYQTEVADPGDPLALIPNPETKKNFARRIILEGVKAVLAASEAKADAETARVAAIANADALDITIT